MDVQRKRERKEKVQSPRPGSVDKFEGQQEGQCVWSRVNKRKSDRPEGQVM